MKKVLLHACCGVCAFACLEKLKSEGFAVSLLFFNPNIHPEVEYLKRLATAGRVSEISSVELLKTTYEPKQWFDKCGGYKKEPEGGKRCLLCYELRLKKTFEIARLKGFDCFTTTLTISPHKRSKGIFNIGKEIGGGFFLDFDFKKQEGFKRTIERAKEHGLYRQNYCGCIYSKR